jgi:hypothetical protein
MNVENLPKGERTQIEIVAAAHRLFLAVLRQQHPYVRILPALVSARGDMVAAYLRNAAHRMVDSFEESSDYLNLLFIELVEFDGQHISSLFQEIYPRGLEIAQRLVQGREELQPIPLPVPLRAFIGLFFLRDDLSCFIRKQMPVEMQANALEYFVDIFLYGV